MATHYSIETCDHLGGGAEVLRTNMVGPIPDIGHDLVFADGSRWRVLVVEHREVNNGGVLETRIVVRVERGE